MRLRNPASPFRRSASGHQEQQQHCSQQRHEAKDSPLHDFRFAGPQREQK
jgi:hypothetical protein